jgi:SET domain-containing protein
MEGVKAPGEEGGPIVGSSHVTFASSTIHGLGGFAKQDLPNGTPLIEYVGEKIAKDESARRCGSNNEYIFSLDDQYDIDGKVDWNLARFINHSCAPNCEAEVREGRIWIVAARDIRAGEELTFNYGFDLEDYRNYPCRCGAPDCVGYIVAEEFFEHVRAQRQWAQNS